MNSSPREHFHLALNDLIQALHDFGTPWMIIGGLAVIANGYARLTNDIDLSVLVEESDIDRLVALLEKNQFEMRMANARAFAHERHVLLLRHERTEVPIDLSFAMLPFQLQALKRSKIVRLFDLDLHISSCEDLIVTKLVAYRPRDLDDVENLLAMHANQLDYKYIWENVKEFSQLLEMPEMLSTLESRWSKISGKH